MVSFLLFLTGLSVKHCHFTDEKRGAHGIGSLSAAGSASSWAAGPRGQPVLSVPCSLFRRLDFCAGASLPAQPFLLLDLSTRVLLLEFSRGPQRSPSASALCVSWAPLPLHECSTCRPLDAQPCPPEKPVPGRTCATLHTPRQTPQTPGVSPQCVPEHTSVWSILNTYYIREVF